MNSSSVNHFIMDGGKKFFRSAFLFTDKDVELRYENTNDRGIEFFVAKGTKPTWLELRELCGDRKRETA